MFEKELKKSKARLKRTIDFEDLVFVLREVKDHNPYPKDIFVSVEGQAARISWDNCVDEVFTAIDSYLNERYLNDFLLHNKL